MIFHFIPFFSRLALQKVLAYALGAMAIDTWAWLPLLFLFGQFFMAVETYCRRRPVSNFYSTYLVAKLTRFLHRKASISQAGQLFLGNGSRAFIIILSLSVFCLMVMQK
jgi:hypothetical protein